MKPTDYQELAIRVQNVSKTYRLGQIGGATLREDVQRWIAQRRPRTENSSAERQEPPGDISGSEEIQALDNISLSIPVGESLGIIGRNGAGKSTLLKLITGITAPTSGTIEVSGRTASMLEVGTGFHRELTGRENTYLNGAILGMSKQEVSKKMDQIIAFSEIGPYIDTPVKRYSSGMYVKLAFSVAAHLDSDILIMDEVLAVGDARFRRKCLDRLQSAVKKEGRTILCVSHNMHTIRQICDRCILLDRGKLVFAGTPDEAISRYLETTPRGTLSVALDQISRRSDAWKHTAQLLAASFPNRDSAVFLQDEEMDLRISFRRLSEISSICLRIEFWTPEDLPAASCILRDLPFSTVREETSYDVRIGLSLLAPGEYRMKYTLFFLSSSGEATNADSVAGLAFTLLQGPGAAPMAWDTAHWGFIMLPDISAKQVN